jgi:hypothetical protein
LTSLATFTVTDSTTSSSKLLAAGGKALYIFPTIRKGEKSSVLSNDPMYDGADELYVAQAGEHISIWFKNREQILGYHRGDYTADNKFKAKPPIPLTTAGQAAQYAPIIDPKSKSQRLLVADNAGNLTLKEQAVDSGLWKDTPFLVPHPTKYLEYVSYTVHIGVTDKSGAPLANTKLLLACSDWVTVTVNGQTFAISTLGVAVSTDARGTLTIIVPSSDIFAYTFVVKDLPETHNFSTTTSIDPTTKVFDQLKGMTLQRLRDARTADNKPVIDPSVSDADLQKAAKAISDMHDVKKTIQERAVDGIARAPAADGLVGDFWDAMHWIKERWDHVADWLVHKVNDAWQFVVSQ